MTSDFEWVAEVEEEVPTRFQTAEELKAFLAELEQTVSGHLVIDKDYGLFRPRWWERLLGRSGRDRRVCFMLGWRGSYARLDFMDDCGSVYIALDHEQPVDAPEDIRLQLSGGEPTPAPPEECMQKTRAFAAAREFIDTGTRPEWLSYRYVR
jgi:hypothetical protein